MYKMNGMGFIDECDVYGVNIACLKSKRRGGCGFLFSNSSFRNSDKASEVH